MSDRHCPSSPGASLAGGVCVAAALLLSLTSATAAADPLRVPGPLSPRNASYRIRARLDEKAHKVTGTVVLSWRNLERQPVDSLLFHLYLNAFKNEASTFVHEAGTQLRGDEMAEHGYGAIDVTRLVIGQQDLLAVTRIDDTLMSVPLRQPVGPGAAVEVEIDFATTLPKVFARSGYVGEFFAVGQWFPKIGVWDCGPSAQVPAGGCRWRAHQYHGSTEFFADYGTYDVELDVPRRYVVGATGVPAGERQEGERKILRFAAADVHDFMWTADPRFVEVREQLQDAVGSVEISLLTRAGQEAMVGRHLRATREGLLELERRFGPYPYSKVTVIIPPADAAGAGGMEYPTIFTSLAADVPAGLRILDAVTLHELGHQYFYGILGTDEVEEAWLDEGMNETFTTWGVERLFGQRCNSIELFGMCLSAVDQEWLGYRVSRRREPMITPSHRLRGIYGSISYAQTAVTMRTLERYLGSARMEAGMRRYADRYRFHHPRREDFIQSFDEGAGEDLRWFWDQALSTTRVADYAVHTATTKPHRPAPGLWDCPPPADLTQRAAAPPLDPDEDPIRAAHVVESWQAACAGKQPGRHEHDPDKGKLGKDKKGQTHDARVWVQRRGELIFPVTIRLTFKDGAQRSIPWSREEQVAAPESRMKYITVTGQSTPLVRAEVDPEGVLLLDERRLNNGLLVTPDPGPARRLFSTWQTLVQAACALLGA